LPVFLEEGLAALRPRFSLAAREAGFDPNRSFAQVANILPAFSAVTSRPFGGSTSGGRGDTGVGLPVIVVPF
jgi:hypothetical protein